MKFKKGRNIVITDPCYLIREETKYLDSETSEYGTKLDRLGFTDFMVSNTGVGDGTWKVYTTPCDLSIVKYYLEKFYKSQSSIEKLLKSSKEIGGYAADSGQTCVVYKDEILGYNPGFFSSINPTCFTEIVNDSGFDVEFWKISSKFLHIGGISGDRSLKFFTY
jgi:hypothetical protein